MHGPLLLSLLPPLLLLSLLPAALGGSAKAVLHSWDLGAWTRLGSVTLEETPGTGKVRVSGVLNGLSPGQHGFHIHALGDLENGCSGAGGHFNPAGLTHGAPTAAARHAGDLGNILADAQGRALVDISDGGFSLYGPDSVVGRAVMVHAGRDDLGLGGDAESLKTGNAGARVACGVIGVASEGFVVMPEEAKLSSGPNLDPAQLNFQPPDSHPPFLPSGGKERG